MTGTAPEIRVSAMFPLDAQSSDWNWVHCLTFPLDTLNKLQFTPRPYKWIRYATGVVVGAQGDLSFSPVSPHSVVDYNLDLPSESAELFYHTSDAERQKMFPADPDMSRTSVTSSDVSSLRMQFRNYVVKRDGVCVLTGFKESNCDAVHLLAHSKGNEYIETYTRRRSRDPTGNDIVDEIDDVRNGILLNLVAQGNFGTRIAFLMTPNFAMSTADIESTAPPTDKRCTAHLFVPDKSEHFGWPLRSGSLVRMPDTADDWPPDILFDAVYANAVLRHFAPQTLRDTLKQWKHTFYPSGIGSAAKTDHQAIIDERAGQNERRNKNHAHDQRAAKRGNRTNRAAEDCDDYFDLLMILPYIMIPPDKLEATWRKAEEKRAETERRRLEDKVVGWAKEVADACP